MGTPDLQSPAGIVGYFFKIDPQPWIGHDFFLPPDGKL
jgi:hypothetical protein